MADIKNLKITEDKTRGKHVADLPVNPTENGMSAQELQGHFDALPKVAIDAFNDLVDALKENGAGDKITPQSVGARPDTWMPTASDVGAMTQGKSSIHKDYTTVLEAARAIPTSGTIFAVEGTNLINAEDSPFPTIEMQYLVLVDDKSRRTVVAFRYGAGVESIWVRTIFNDHWMYDGWREFARMDKVLPLDGSVPMSGTLQLLNGYGQVWCGSNVINIFSRNTPFDDSNGRYLGIYNSTLCSVAHAVALTENINGEATAYNIFGEHNKPSGSYTGNGSATSRTIDIVGANANIVHINGNGYSCLVSPNGAFYFNTGGNMNGIPLSKLKYSDGKLQITGADAFMNASGVTYYYFLL